MCAADINQKPSRFFFILELCVAYLNLEGILFSFLVLVCIYIHTCSYHYLIEAISIFQERVLFLLGVESNIAFFCSFNHILSDVVFVLSTKSLHFSIQLIFNSNNTVFFYPLNYLFNQVLK